MELHCRGKHKYPKGDKESMKIECEIKVSKSLLKKIKLGDKWTLTTSDVKGKKIKQVLTVNGICSSGVIDLS